MAEQLVNEFTVNRPIEEAWAVITDVERIALCLPGAELQEIEGDVYRGVVKVKLGSITPRSRARRRSSVATTLGTVPCSRPRAGHRRAGNAAAEITAQAESLSPTSTGAWSRRSCTSPAASPSSAAASSATYRRS